MKKYCSECIHYNSCYDLCTLKLEVIKKIHHQETHAYEAYDKRVYKKYKPSVKNKNHDCVDFVSNDF